MPNKVHILFTGYSRPDEDEPGCMRANCTCSLIQTESGRNIIVDTMTAWDGARILEALRTLNVEPKDIYAVVCSHGHSDHVGCNYLFPLAEYHFIGTCVSYRDKYFEWGGTDRQFQLDGDNVIVTTTPGHTLSCVSVIVQNTSRGIVGLCGDLFECAEDIENPSLWLGAGCENPIEQQKQRLRMIETCSYIIPGHGEGFAVDEEMRAMLRQQYEKGLDVVEEPTKDTAGGDGAGTLANKGDTEEDL